MYSFDENSAINDFIFLFFLVGNDFLPHIPSIEIIEDGIELILAVYKEVCISHGHITHTESGRVRFVQQPLQAFLGTIGHHEQENLEQKLQKKASFFPDPLLENCATQGERGKWKVDIDRYKELYLSTSFRPRYRSRTSLSRIFRRNAVGTFLLYQGGAELEMAISPSLRPDCESIGNVYRKFRVPHLRTHTSDHTFSTVIVCASSEKCGSYSYTVKLSINR